MQQPQAGPAEAGACCQDPTQPIVIEVEDVQEGGPVSPSSDAPFTKRGQKAKTFRSFQQGRGAKVFENYQAAVLGRQESQGSLLLQVPAPSAIRWATFEFGANMCVNHRVAIRFDHPLSRQESF